MTMSPSSHLPVHFSFYQSDKEDTHAVGRMAPAVSHPQRTIVVVVLVGQHKHYSVGRAEIAQGDAHTVTIITTLNDQG